MCHSTTRAQEDRIPQLKPSNTLSLQVAGLEQLPTILDNKKLYKLIEFEYIKCEILQAYCKLYTLLAT